MKKETMSSHQQTTQPSKDSHYLAVLGLLFGAVCWGVIWYPYRIMAGMGVSGVASSFYTYAITVFLAGLYFFKDWRGLFKQPVSIVYLALVAGWTNLAYVLAVIDGEVMRVMLLFYLSPLWTLLLAHFYLQEKTPKSGYLAIAISLLGAFIMLYEPALSPWPLPRNQAEWLALSSGMGFSLTNVLTRQASGLSLQAKSFAVWLGVLLVSLLFMLFSAAIWPSPSFFDGYQWLVMGLIALLLLAATLLVQYGVTKLPATRASVVFLFELVVAAIASYYLANESMALNEWLGGSLIVLAALFAAKST